ncbi:hypothetical protein [Pedobacter heparinus]|uniref:hypothetical protein n=1 Tax=Pedobacter heparinus TaxID=984 RepID=UPI00292DCD19|nr:hypothetical protein [Pedobacter heparinus]
METITELIEIGTMQVPVQTTGSEMNAIEEVQCKSIAEAAELYQTVKNRLINVNSWAALASLPMSSFKLFDYAGRTACRNAAEGDFIRIDIPGPGTRTGHGYDWVIIEALVEESGENAEAISMRVRPAPHPLGDDEYIAHFLKSCATSTFQVKRIGNCVSAEEHGRNEVANLETGNLLDNIRNAIVSAGAKIGFSYPQWKSLVSGLLSDPQK